MLLYFFAFLFICFLLPAFLTKRNIQANSENVTELVEEQSQTGEGNSNQVKEQNPKSEYDYKQ